VSESIVVGTDGSDTAKRAVAEAVRLASALGAQLHVVSAYEPLRGARVAGGAKLAEPRDALVESTLSEAAAVARFSGVNVTTHAVRSEPTDALMELAAEVDASLVVVGNQGMQGAKRLLGSVPNSVSHKARCNVLIVATGTKG
jgi:nucleotide-binding universal stress UspA family protein